jgi:2',3'-cyclic-nucleotide 2'-phosphodiesterase/3'-nucleotidase
VKTPVGSTDFRMTTYFADVGDVSAIQVVNAAQTGYVKNYVAANLPQYAKLPVLSMSAPFKSGSAGAFDFTDVPAGEPGAEQCGRPVPVSECAVCGEGRRRRLKAWLETSARRFNTIDPGQGRAAGTGQHRFPSYNFDTPTSRRSATRST